MKIAQIAPVVESVPPPKYGGTELVVSNLTEGLVARGHDVHLFGAGSSHTKAKLHAWSRQPLRARYQGENYSAYRDAAMYQYTADLISELQKLDADIIHNHIGWRLLPFASLFRAPMVTTLHGLLDPPYMNHFMRHYGSTPFVSISDAQRRPAPRANYVRTIYHGIETRRFDFNPHPQDYVAFLGRLSPLKGPKQAILAAKAAGLRLVIGAKIDPVDQEFFDQEIKPLIDGKQIQFLGEVDHAGKVALLKNARAMLALIQWEEPFGLFLVEALACGTPVIAIPRGSVPEVIHHGVTGLLVDGSLDQSVKALQSIDGLDRSLCRQVAVERFDIQRMVSDYEAVYRELRTTQLGSRKLPSFSRRVKQPVLSHERAIQ